LNNGLFGGVISGAGQLIINGPVTLTGANTYTGGTMINGILLAIGHGGTTGSIAGNVTDNTALVFDRSNNITFAGVISGPGTVVNSGAGVLTLSGNNGYSGGTFIDAGAVAVTNGNALGAGNVNFTNGTALLSTGTVTLNNGLLLPASASATVTIATNGTLNLSKLDMVPAVQNILNFGSPGNAGVVDLLPNAPGSAGAPDAVLNILDGTLRNGGGLGFFTAQAAGTTVATGATLSVNDASMTVKNLSGSGMVALGSLASTALTLNGANFSGVISGTGQLVTHGSVTLAGASTYTGGTTLGLGTLVAQNASGSATGTGPVTIESGATLGGRGTVSGAMTLDGGGTIAPGIASIGTPGTKFHGSSLTWNGGGTLDFQIGSTADELLLTGALKKGTAGTFTIEIDDAGVVAGNYTLMTFASTTFSLSDFTLDLPMNFSGTLVKTSTSLSIDNLHDPPPTQLPSVNDAGATLTANGPATGGPGVGEGGVLPTPEPGSGLLLAFGGGALLGWKRRHTVDGGTKV
jgi:autotransporter-associated beta strand protein